MIPERPVWLGLPRDNFGWLALGCSALCLLLSFLLRDRIAKIPRRAWTLSFASLAFALSYAYVHFYLRGGPRIIDATSYWLEAKAISHGMLSWDIPEPTACFRGRFLLHHSSAGSPSQLGVIFPPGYPAILALGMLLGHPLLVGPLIAFLLVILTDKLAMQLTSREDVARFAVVLSALCATLRYHTADTMSHGLSALALGSCVLFALRAIDRSTRRPLLCFVASGAFFGLLGATRPFSAAALACVALAFLLPHRPSLRGFTSFTLGAVSPLLLLLLHHHAATGAWFRSTQHLYYLLSDGPPGCFRYGFGHGIGCLIEHGSYVESVLPHGFGLSPVLLTTLRRLRQHTVDLANFEPLILLAFAGMWAGRHSRRIWFASAIPAAVVLAYAPFYFDGSYPGGGARFYVDALPLAHVVMALALASWSSSFQNRTRALSFALATLAAFMLFGFAIRASHEHRLLRERDGARPLFEPDFVRETLGTARGLLWVDTDHAFNLAYDPSVRDASRGLFVARMRFDDRDRMLWESLGRPPAWRYIFHPWEKDETSPRVIPWQPASLQDDSFRFEAEVEWPPLAQSGGYAVPTYLAPGSCVSSGRALALVRSAPASEVCATVEIPSPSLGQFELRPWLVLDTDASLSVHFIGESGERTPWPMQERVQIQASEHEKSPLDGRWCVALPPLRVGLGPGHRGRLELCSREPWLALDRVTLSPVR